MRRLNKKQQNALTKLSEQGHQTIDTIDPEDFVRIEQMNDHETFYQNADRFLNDKYFEKIKNN